MLLRFRHRQILAEVIPPSLPHAKRAELREIRADAALQLNDRKTFAATLKEIEELRVNLVGELSIRATLAMREGRLEDACRYTDRAVATARDHPLVRLARASLRHRENDRQGALGGDGKVIAREPANVHARLARIGLLFDMQRYANTERDFEFFQARDSADPRFLFLKAIRYQAVGDLRLARETLAEVVKLLETTGRRIVSGSLRLLIIAGIANYRLGNLELAECDLGEYVKVPGGEAETRRLLAAILIGKQDFASAIKLLKPILEEQGESADQLALLTRADSGEGRHQRAAEALERATMLRPGDPALATSLAMSKATRGQSEAALARVFDAEETGETAGMPLAILQLNRQD
jgi:tetratricopeptide (TPR) repeat protein